MAARKILILFAHPSQERSEVNIHLFKSAQNMDNITVVDLYREYPTHRIDVDREQQRLRQHDVIIFLFPMYWYSTPAILKDWQDLVLEYDFAFGKHGDALQGKYFFCATTAGGAEHAYGSDGYNHYTVRELLRPLEQTANLCKMIYLAPFILYSARTAAETERLTEHIELWKKLLTTFLNDEIDLNLAQSSATLNTVIQNTSGQLS